MSFDRKLLQRYTNWFNRPDSYTAQQNSTERSGEQNKKRDKSRQRWPPSPAEIIRSIEHSDCNSSSNSVYGGDNESESTTDSNMSKLGYPRVEKPSRIRIPARSKKKQPAKSQKVEIPIVHGSQKRPTPGVSEVKDRASKVQKTESTDLAANMAKTGRKEAINSKKNAKGQISDHWKGVISLLTSDEEDVESEGGNSRTSFYNQPSVDIGSVTIKNEDSTSSMLDEANAPISSTTVEEARWGHNVHSEENERSNANDLRTALEQCRKALDAQTDRAGKAEAQVTKLEQWRDDFREQVHNEKQAAKNDMRQTQETTKQKIAELESSYHIKVNQLTENYEQLAAELEKANSERHQLQVKHDEICSQTLAITTEQGELRRKLEAEQQKSANATALEAENAMLRNDLDGAKKTDIPNLQAENACLRGDLEEVQMDYVSLMQQLDATGSQLHKDIATSKPLSADSSIPSDLEQRCENVRRAFLKAKRQYDSLFSIARNITASTRGMPLGNFGEVGKYLRQLRTAVEEGERSEEAKENGASKLGGDESGVMGQK